MTKQELGHEMKKGGADQQAKEGPARRAGPSILPPFYPRDDQALLAFTFPHAEMIQRFGPAHRPMDAEDHEPGPCEYWSFRFPCGLTTFITYHFSAPTGAGGVVTSSSPDIDHILRHLPIEDGLFWRLDQAEPDFYRQLYGIASDHCPRPTDRSNDHDGSA